MGFETKPGLLRHRHDLKLKEKSAHKLGILRNMRPALLESSIFGYITKIRNYLLFWPANIAIELNAGVEMLEN